jgi:hypothetical protein
VTIDGAARLIAGVPTKQRQKQAVLNGIGQGKDVMERAARNCRIRAGIAGVSRG